MTVYAIGDSQRPFQKGRIHGTASGVAVTHPVCWLIDTGADYTALLPDLYRLFTTTPRGALTAPPSGLAYRLATGVDVEFTVVRRTGLDVIRMRCEDVALKEGNTGSNLIGMPELASARAVLHWDAAAGMGDLTS